MEKRERVLFDDGTHKCVMFCFEDQMNEKSFLSVNQYLIVHDGIGTIIDPGSNVIFEKLFSSISKHIDIDKIEQIFLSHQDPDVSASVEKWAQNTKAKFIISNLWTRFLSHYGFSDMSRVMPLYDHGARMDLGESHIEFIPAHFLHSAGNFSLYDSHSKILFSGDIGAAVVNKNHIDYEYVQDFDKHMEALSKFHKRYMGSNKFCQAWVNSLEKLEINMIAPQHGLVFKEDNVDEFLEWFKNLECGSDLLNELYKIDKDTSDN